MRIIREFVKESIFLIPAPPSQKERIKELKLIISQIENPYNSRDIHALLDKNFPDLFDAILTKSGHDSQIELIKKIKKEIRPLIKLHKNYFNEIRPRELAEKLNIDLNSKFLKSAQTPSYPSGHTTQAFYLAHKLSEDYPDLRDKFFLLAEMVAQSRIDSGVHFPSDNDAGKILAYKIYKENLL